jgi:hypothetical protein
MTSPSSLVVFSFAILAAVVSLPVPAAACPPGSRFSVKPDGTNPICIVIGQGLKIRARCFEMTSAGCPLGAVHKRSNQAPGRVYCCPA